MRNVFRLSSIVLAIGFCCMVRISNANAQPPAFLIRKHADWKYHVGDSRAPEHWTTLSFDDSMWKSGPAGFGYGDSDDATEVADLEGKYSSIYLRHSFEWKHTANIESLYLYVNFDDGFIAYLNGTQVSAAAVTRHGNTVRVEQHEAGGYEVFEIRDAKSLVKDGANILAIEGHNVSLDSSDFSLDPFLTTSKLDNPTEALDPADFLLDIQFLEERLFDQSSYLTRRGFDVDSALEHLRKSIHSRTQLAGFSRDVQKLIMQIGDCHARVELPMTQPTELFLPLRPADTDKGIVALRMHQDQPLDAACPYLESLDGVPLERWMDAAALYAPRGSPQLVRRRSLDQLGNVALLRMELSLPAADTIVVGLRSANATKHSSQTLKLTRQGYSVARVRLLGTRRLDEDIGYVRIPAMDDRLIEPTIASLKSFRNNVGLIIDVRDNSGGTYGVTRGIYGFFVPDDSAPFVTNIAAYRLSTMFSPDHIEYRPTYRADWNGWTEVERAAIQRAADRFNPEWTLPAGKFSPWHYMILSRERSGRKNVGPNHRRSDTAHDYFYYDKPVVVLCNAECFSAADGFLNAFAELPQVTIVGEPSAGGSGATREFRLPRSQVLVALSSMASFRPNGKLFDGNGIEVDIAIKPTLEDYVTGRDSVLARGIQVILAKQNP